MRIGPQTKETCQWYCSHSLHSIAIRLCEAEPCVDIYLCFEIEIYYASTTTSTYTMTSAMFNVCEIGCA
jgi:hypothetical protein